MSNNDQSLLKDITVLASAGFSRDEILALISPAPAQAQAVTPAPIQGTEPNQLPAVPEPTQPAQAIPAPTPAAQAIPAQAPAVSPVQVTSPAPAQAQTHPIGPAVPYLSEDQFAKLIQSVNAGNAGIDIPPKYNLDKVLADHYTSLVGGNIKKED